MLEVEDVTGKLKFVLAEGATLNGRVIRCTDLPYGIVIGVTGSYCE
jgi:tetrahydromethanopterin S-methyltransferase subunit G